MSLAWTGKSRWALDGSDETGARVASIQRYQEPLPDSIAFASYWMAFVRQPDFEPVLVDGAPGRWATRAEAQAAAERTFAGWLAGGGDRAAVALAAASVPPKPVSRGRNVLLIVRGIAGTTWAAWRRSGGGRTPARADDRQSDEQS